MNRRLVVMTPSKGSVCIEQRDMLMRLAVRLRAAGHFIETVDDCTSGFLHHSRNLLLATLAMKMHRVDWALWLDSDMYFDPNVVIAMMDRDGPEEVVMWNYPKRCSFDLFNPPEKHSLWAADVRKAGSLGWTAAPLVSHNGELLWSEDKRLIKIAQCGFGAVLMRPSVAVKMAKAFPQPKRDWCGRMVIPSFNLMDDTIGEDYSWSRRWAAMGGAIWCDPTPYINNGQSGGRFTDEIVRASAMGQAIMPLFAVQC